MKSFKSALHRRGDENGRDQTGLADLGELGRFNSFHQNEASDINMAPTGTACLDSRRRLRYPPAATAETVTVTVASSENKKFENWDDAAVIDNGRHSDASTDIDTDDRNQFCNIQHGALVDVDSLEQFEDKSNDKRALRRLAQNREAARKSRLKRKAYIQQLESSRQRLVKLEEELQQARQQGMFIASSLSGDQGNKMEENGALAFNEDYARWLGEHERRIGDLRSALNSHTQDNELHLLVDEVVAHYDELFRLKSLCVKADAFHMLSGMWKTPAERFFMWLGGFRPSEVLKMLGNHLEPLTDHQFMGIFDLQHSSQQAEDALSQGMEVLQQSLINELSSASFGLDCSSNVEDYAGWMAMATDKLAMIEKFLHQADLLRQQTLQHVHRILTAHQAARALLVLSDYISRLRTLSSLWLSHHRH